ncbi:hypothetical protein HZ994_18180 [Akkermansiaceae bacterium]|nr:hypothetical protein HZ994_18180 [Akkermansiaceae bacterium]
MSSLKILSFFLANKEASAELISSSLLLDKDLISSELYRLKERGLTQFSSYDYSWSLTERGRFYASDNRVKISVSKSTISDAQKSTPQKSNPRVFNAGDEVKIEIGDVVKIKFDDESYSFSFTIVRGRTSWDDRRIGHEAPLAETIMQRKVKLGLDSSLSVNGRSFRVIEVHRRNQE